MTEKLSSKSLWAALQSDFQSLFPHDVYRTWFEPLRCLSEDEDKIVLGVPNDFAAIWIEDNYRELIQNRLQMAAGHPVELSLQVVETPAAVAERTEDPAPVNRLGDAAASQDRLGGRLGGGDAGRERSGIPASRLATSESLPLNPKNTFENFVVGPGSQLAHAACIAVANAPARAYNPLFLYGDTGLGKTHLMHAVAHCILRNNHEARVAYVSTEKFTNEFIRAIQENSLSRFRQRYRSVDALLIDDIHFLSGKERIQEEFFHTFNELFESQKQIFLSSDRSAGEISKLEARLVSRFQWGLVTDIQPPDLETRVAILAKKAAAMKLSLPDEIIQFLAERVSRNVRRMEGALTRVAGYAALMQSKVDVPTVEKLLQDILQEEAQNQISVEKIQQKVSEFYHLRLADMVSKRRPANIAFPRQVAMYLSRMLTSHSLQEIGDAFGGRDHGTVIHACKTVENMMDQDESVRRSVEYLQQQLGHRRF